MINAKQALFQSILDENFRTAIEAIQYSVGNGAFCAVTSVELTVEQLWYLEQEGYNVSEYDTHTEISWDPFPEFRIKEKPAVQAVVKQL